MSGHTIHLGTTTGTLARSLETYQAAWKAFLVVHHLEVLEHQARPVTFSWKVADKHELFAALESNAGAIEQLHTATVNGRFIASAVLHAPYADMPIMKIMERRQGSSDPLGLDSIDYLVTDTSATFQLLQDAGAHVEREHNDLYDWLSLRFGKNGEYEAKFNDSLVLKVAITELELASQRITGV